jgi:hypothetical protein
VISYDRPGPDSADMTGRVLIQQTDTNH